MVLRTLLIWSAVLFTCSPAYAGGTLWKVRPDGVGPISIGMRCDAVGRILKEPICTPTDPLYVRPRNLEGLELLFIDGVLSRLRVEGSLRTIASGISIGDPVAKIEKLYGASLHRESIPYDDRAQDLTVAFGQYAVAFETYDGKVASIFVGYRDQIGYLE